MSLLCHRATDRWGQQHVPMGHRVGCSDVPGQQHRLFGVGRGGRAAGPAAAAGSSEDIKPVAELAQVTLTLSPRVPSAEQMARPLDEIQRRSKTLRRAPG